MFGGIHVLEFSNSMRFNFCLNAYATQISMVFVSRHEHVRDTVELSPLEVNPLYKNDNHTFNTSVCVCVCVCCLKIKNILRFNKFQ